MKKRTLLHCMCLTSHSLGKFEYVNETQKFVKPIYCVMLLKQDGRILASKWKT